MPSDIVNLLKIIKDLGGDPSNIPGIQNEFLRQISDGEVMTDPVITPTGQTYDRTEITEWINKHHNHPETREPLEVAALIPNLAFRKTIEDFLKKEIERLKKDTTAAATTTTTVSTVTAAPAPSTLSEDDKAKPSTSTVASTLVVDRLGTADPVPFPAATATPSATAVPTAATASIAKMKTQTFGIDSTCPEFDSATMRALLLQWTPESLAFERPTIGTGASRKVAVEDYIRHRLNFYDNRIDIEALGDRIRLQQLVKNGFPVDGTFTLVMADDYRHQYRIPATYSKRCFVIRYDAGSGDERWMKVQDEKYYQSLLCPSDVAAAHMYHDSSASSTPSVPEPEKKSKSGRATRFFDSAKTQHDTSDKTEVLSSKQPHISPPACAAAAPSPYSHFKIGIFGDSGVGKSCLLLRFVDDTYTENYISTIGCDFKTTTRVIDGQTVKLQIWDFPGNSEIRASAYSSRGFQAAMFVVDVTDRTTWENILPWLTEVEKLVGEGCIRVLVASKTDREDKRRVSSSELENFAETHNMLYVSTSAKYGTGVEEAFIRTAEELMKKYGRLIRAREPTPEPAPSATGSPEKQSKCIIS